MSSTTQTHYVELVLTCGSWQEAQSIADRLLEERLIACAESFEIKSKFWWENQLDDAKEIKLIMQSVEGHFEKIEAIVRELHSYETFVLKQIKLERLSKDAADWLDRETKKITDRID